MSLSSLDNMYGQKLLDIVNRLRDLSCAEPFDAAELATIISKDLNSRIVYPGSYTIPKFDGLMDLIARAHTAAPGFQVTIQDTDIDEATSIVVGLVVIKGVHSGYSFPISGLILGIGLGLLELEIALSSRQG